MTVFWIRITVRFGSYGSYCRYGRMDECCGWGSWLCYQSVFLLSHSRRYSFPFFFAILFCRRSLKPEEWICGVMMLMRCGGVVITYGHFFALQIDEY